MVSVTEIKGIGQKRAGELADRGIFSIDDLAAVDETAVQLVSASLGISAYVVASWVAAAKQYQIDEIPFGEDDEKVYEHFLTGKREVKSIGRGN